MPMIDIIPLLKEIQLKFQEQAYPFIHEKNKYKFNFNGNDYTVEAPSTKYINLQIPYMTLYAEPKNVVDLLIHGFDEMKNNCGITDKWLGWIKITEPVHAITTATISINIITSIIPIDKDLHNIKFNNKLLSVINE